MRATSENGEWWQMVAKWRMVAIRIPSRLKKPRTNIERLIDSTQDHSNKKNLETAVAVVRRRSSK